MTTYTIDFSSVGDIEVYKVFGGVFDLNGNNKYPHVSQYARELTNIIGTTYIPAEHGWSIMERTFSPTIYDITVDDNIASALAVTQYHGFKLGLRLKLDQPSAISTTADFDAWMYLCSGYINTVNSKTVNVAGNSVTLTVNHVVIWNEPDTGQWTGSSTDFANFMVSACQTLKALYPNIKFGAFALGDPGNVEWLQEFGASCTASGYDPDFISIHLYHQYPTLWESYDLINTYKSYFSIAPEVFIEEWNVTFASEDGDPFTPTPEVDNYKGASYLLTNLITCINADVEHQAYFYLQDRTHDNNRPQLGTHEEYGGRSVGLFTLYNAPKANWFALRKLTEVTKYPACTITRALSSNEIEVITNGLDTTSFNISGEWTTQCFASRNGETGYIVVTNIGNTESNIDQALADLRNRNIIDTLGTMFVSIGHDVSSGASEAVKSLLGAAQVLSFYNDTLDLNDLSSGVSASTYFAANPTHEDEVVRNKAYYKEVVISNGNAKTVTIEFENDSSPISITNEYLIANGSNDPATNSMWLSSGIGDVTGYYQVTGTYPSGIAVLEAIDARLQAFDRMKLNRLFPSINRVSTLLNKVLTIILPAWGSVILEVSFKRDSGPNPSFPQKSISTPQVNRRVGQYIKYG